jgi:5-methyltetrahydrofolate--homocysteine methyltransferase
MNNKYLGRIKLAIVEYKLQDIEELVKLALSNNLSSTAIIDTMVGGMAIVGERFERSEYFLPELVMAGKTMKAGLAIAEPYMKGMEKKARAQGCILIGTMEGDLHDIGKNILATMLQISGFKVHDLGVDVTTDKWIENIKEISPDIVAMSALLLTTREEMKKVIERMKEEGLRENVKVMVGGAPVTDDFANQIGADGYGKDAWEGTRKAVQLMDS